MTKTSFGDQLQQMWQTRPVRLPRQGPIAGVAAGFARRYDIDPVLVRVAFVVSTIFGGAGIVLYLLAWLLLSASGDQASAAESLVGKGHSSQSQTKSIVLIVALAIAVSTMGPVGVGLGGSGLISLGLMLAGWWMLHLRTPMPPPGTTEAFGGFAPDGGITATGYPGAVFPQGTPRTVGDMYVPPSAMYTPYTKLPDSYVPETQARVADGDAETVLLDKDVADQQGSDAAAVVLDKPAANPTSDQAGNTVSATAQTGPNASTGDETEAPLSGRADLAASIGDRSESSTSIENTGPSAGADRSSFTIDAGGGPSTPHAAAARPAIARSATPPSWDPLGAAPLAWDLPEPVPARTLAAPPPKRPRSRLTPVVIGLAILAAAGAGAAAASGVEWMTPGRIGAVALAVIGLGLVLGAFLRRGYGLLVLTAPLAGFVLLASAVGPIDFDRGAMGDFTWTPTSVAELEPQYQVNMGTGTLDLRSLKLTENRTVDIDAHMAEVRVLLPTDMTVRTDCTASMAEAICDDGISGPNTPGTPVLELNVDIRLGNVEVRRG
ncbi:PspC domain-containing protein [Nocardia sp. NBC_00508]|uniref:PspC domain-containing protein n=1 Tax=Nocardia sp. NBC_00508 TaxID=2975992 RepID=UPI002E80A9B6|nr:PspC domain-containing protein [Nocardia sp. NBC_00508]WUD68558.1 PspC domain-containing protein [Nocardia sp. NBC_00508]